MKKPRKVHTYRERSLYKDKRGRFHDAITGKFVSTEHRLNQARATYGAMNLKGKYGRAADSLALSTGLDEDRAQAVFKKFLHQYGDWVLGKAGNRPDLYLIAKRG